MRATYKHYENGKGYDVIDFIKDYDLNFNRGNAIKYLVRASHKGSEEQDLEKAIDYIHRELEYIRETKQDNPPY